MLEPLILFFIGRLVNHIQVQEPDLVRPLIENNSQLPAWDYHDVNRLIVVDASDVDQVRLKSNDFLHCIIFAKYEPRVHRRTVWIRLVHHKEAVVTEYHFLEALTFNLLSACCRIERLRFMVHRSQFQIVLMEAVYFLTDGCRNRGIHLFIRRLKQVEETFCERLIIKLFGHFARVRSANMTLPYHGLLVHNRVSHHVGVLWAFASLLDWAIRANRGLCVFIGYSTRELLLVQWIVLTRNLKLERTCSRS